MIKHKKAVFSTITGFFLIVVIVFGLIFFISIYTGLVNITGAAKSDLRSYDIAKQFKGNLLICHGQTRLLESKLILAEGEQGYCALPPSISGYRVVQRPAFGCDPKNWSHGVVDDFGVQVITYNVVVVQDDGVDNCIARLHIHI